MAKDKDKEEKDDTILRIKKEVKMVEQQEDVEKEVTPTKGQGMTNLKSNVTIVKILAIMLRNVEMVLIMLKRKLTLLKRKVKWWNPLCCWHIKEMKVEQATICVETKVCLWSLMNQQMAMLTLETYPEEVKF